LPALAVGTGRPLHRYRVERIQPENGRCVAESVDVQPLGDGRQQGKAQQRGSGPGGAANRRAGGVGLHLHRASPGRRARAIAGL